MLNRCESEKVLRKCGNAAPPVKDIAEAIGVSLPAVYIARSRLGLPARGRATGRPRLERARRQIEDEPGHKIERVTTTVSRLMEFCSEKELQIPTGHAIQVWPLVIFKEGIDNALDACEEAAVPPIIKVPVSHDEHGVKVVIEDNGPACRRRPSRGLSTTTSEPRRLRLTCPRPAAPRAMRSRPFSPWEYVKARAMAAVGRMKNTEVTGETLIEARRIGHRVRFEVNQISQEPNVSRVERRSTVQKGTRIIARNAQPLLCLDAHGK